MPKPSSFTLTIKLAPSFFIGLYWNRGSSKAAIVGICAGIFVVFYTLILPFILEVNNNSSYFIQNGINGYTFLKPNSLFGIDFLTPPSHAFFWSLTLNIVCYLVVSLTFQVNSRERNYAEMFVDIKNFQNLQDNALVWKGEAYVRDIRNVLTRFLGEKRTQRALKIFFTKYKIPQNTQIADARLINFSEKLLTGSIGAASAKILIANVVKEEQVSLTEVLKILEESKENIQINKSLTEKSKELTNISSQLKKANEELIKKDEQKDEFLDTVAHELKTPITGIKAAVELLHDDDEMEKEIKDRFLKNIIQETNRLGRLINNILDFEKLETGKFNLDIQKQDIQKTIKKVSESFSQILSKKNIQLNIKNRHSFVLAYDEDRIIQVFTNLISNSIKFCEPNKGKIDIDYKLGNQCIEVQVIDNGKGIQKEDFDFIFEDADAIVHSAAKPPEQMLFAV